MHSLRHTPKINTLTIVFLFAAGALFSYWSSSKLPPELKLVSSEPHNVWFQADVARVYSNMTQRKSDHYRTKVHPLFSISTYPLISMLHKSGISKDLAVKLFVSATTGLWLILLYAVFRFLDLRIPDAVLFSSLTLVSSAALFWISVPETYLFGSISILLVLAVSAAAVGKVLPERWYALLSATSLSMTVTNWMAGIANTFVNNPWKKSVQITINAFFIVTLLWALQKLLFPSAEFFAVLNEEANYILPDDSGGFLDKIRVFFVHSMIMPEVTLRDNALTDNWPQLSIQMAKLGTTNAVGVAGIIIWLSLLFYGVISVVKDKKNDKFRLVLGLTVLGQLLLHLVYGGETFLYSLHWLPLLVIVSSYGARTTLRPVVIASTIVLVGIAASNNVGQFNLVASNLYSSIRIGALETERELLIDAIKDNPSLSWPRGKGHVILGNAGSSLEQKAYHEPGGNFSPGFKSFGVSFEFFDAQGSWIASSNSIPMDKIKQRLESESGSIVTQTPLYEAAWRAIEGGSWRLDFESISRERYTPVVKISSAGPAGGPVRQLQWQNDTLKVNLDQKLSITPAPELVLFQDEKDVLTIKKDRSSDLWQAADGFSTALLVLMPDTQYSLVITPDSELTDNDKRIPHDQSQVSVSIYDREFERSLDAQVFHLMSGIVGAETRPGDPASYPLNWLRDGAYVIVALAKAGQIDMARYLAGEFIESDFFGGFGAEADAPGLAIWALDEVATRVDDDDYTNYLWPHIERKANLILEMLDAKRPVEKPFSGPIVPSVRSRKYDYLSSVAKASKNGLIQGKMDNHYPIYFVNAVSYLGLTRAAEFAVRVGDKGNAVRYLERAANMKSALSAMLEESAGRTNPRTLIFGLWPSNVAEDDQLYVQLLQDDWEKERTRSGDFVNPPKWTYFEVAKAHQWLFAGDLDRTWKTLRWFWSNQASPGLYTWWEGDGEENTFHLWENVRGWTSPPHVTPHYWTAAEMLLLQLDMLAYEIERHGETHIVIGGGIPADMLKEPVAVNGLQMRHGTLDWNWNGEKVELKWHGRGSPQFILGEGFQEGTEFEVMFMSGAQGRQTRSTDDIE